VCVHVYVRAHASVQCETHDELSSSCSAALLIRYFVTLAFLSVFSVVSASLVVHPSVVICSLPAATHNANKQEPDTYTYKR
jgi:hypothetical protein